MKRLLFHGPAVLTLAAATLLGSTLARSENRGAIADVQDRFLGAWRLVWLEEQGADGNIHRADCTGLLVYSRDGHMSVQVMYRNPQAGASAAPLQYAQGGYEASFGTYQINESTHTFTFHVEGALVRSLIGKDLPRAFELSGKQLIVKSTHPVEHWRVAWEHYLPASKIIVNAAFCTGEGLATLNTSSAGAIDDHLVQRRAAQDY